MTNPFPSFKLDNLPHQNFAGCIKFIKSVGEVYQAVKRVREYHGCGEEKKTWKKIIETVGKHIKWGKGEEDGHFGEENKDLKIGGGKDIKLQGTLYTPALYTSMEKMYLRSAGG